MPLPSSVLPPQHLPFTCAAVADQHELEGGDALGGHLAGESLENGVEERWREREREGERRPRFD